MTRTRASFSWLPGSAIAALILIAGLVGGSWADSLEFMLYDQAQRTSAVTAAPEVVIVSIDHSSLSKLGEWPWSGEVHARLLEKLQSGNARACAFTMPFDTNQGLPALTQALTAYGKAVLPVEVSFGRGLTGENVTALPQRFAVSADNDSVAAARIASTVRWPRADLIVPGTIVGHVALALDSDRIARRDLAAVRVGDTLLPSMATALTTNALQLDISEARFDAARFLHLGDRKIPLDAGLATLPQSFALQGNHSIPRISYWDVYSGSLPPQALADKIVIIGFDDVNAGDGVPTPREADAPPALVIASTTASLLQGSLYSRPLWARALEALVAILVIVVAGWVLPLVGPMFAVAGGTLLAVLIMLLELWVLHSTRGISHLVLPSVALVAAAVCQSVIDLVHRANTQPHEKDPATTLLTLAQTFQKQGQLDLAFETYCRCPIDSSAMDLLYSLGMDFERRRQLQKAQAVYAYMSQYDQNFRDLRVRRARLGGEQPATSPAIPAPSHSSSQSSLPAFPPRPVHPPTGGARIRMLGRYEIERELGKGAMGVVYLGRDPKINRVVAIKAISLAEEFDQEDLAEARARFFREAEMAGRLNHPAIVTVYDAGEDQGLAYIAMEYLQGQHLSAFTNPDQLFPPKTVMLLAARVAEALHYAHRQNVVHRDIKPANIMFNSETDELKITDFGIARLTDVSRTKTGIVLGTPSFMSPEQLEGRSLDGRSDLFALGVSLYQLLTGYLPFRADSMPRLMHKIATEPHVPIRTLRKELPACTDGLIDKALAKDPEDRFQTGAEMAAALRRCAQGT